MVMPCAGTLACRAGTCQSACVTDGDCSSDGRCLLGSCAEAPSGCETAPMACGNAAVDRCELGLQAVAEVVTGGGDGELEVLEPYVLPAQTWPRLSVVDETPLAPDVTLALSGAGYGVVGHVVAGAARTLALYRFPLDEPSAATAVAIEPVVGNALTLALGEDGDDVIGFVLVHPQPAGGGASGHALRLTVDDASQRPISASSDPSTSGGDGTVIGGGNSVWGTDFPTYSVVRELVPASRGGAPVLGAIDSDLGMSTYRSVTTTRLGAELFLDGAGTAGRIAVYRSGAELGVWNVERTAYLSSVGDVPPDDLVIADVAATGAPGAALASVTGLDYVVAVPATTGVDFYDIVCSEIAPCNPPRAHVPPRLSSRSGGAPESASLAALPGGYALVTLEPTSVGHVVDLQFLDEALTATNVQLSGPIVGAMGDPTRSDVVAATVHAVTDGTIVTVIVAALVRDFERRQDHVVLTGVRACVSR